MEEVRQVKKNLKLPIGIKIVDNITHTEQDFQLLFQFRGIFGLSGHVVPVHLELFVRGLDSIFFRRQRRSSVSLLTGKEQNLRMRVKRPRG